MNTAMVPQIGLPTTAHTDAAQVISMIERVVRDPSIDLERLTVMLELRERMMIRGAEIAFNDAMMRTQSEMEPISKDCNNTQTRSRYASYAAMDVALRPIYTKNGFALSFNTTEGAPVNCIRIICDVSNGGHVRSYHIDVPSDGKGARGNDVMTRTHATGSAVTYGMRYLLKMIFNVSFGEADDDGNGASRMTARARNEIIKDDPEECQRVADEYGEREGGRMINGMQPQLDDTVIWGEAEVTSKAQFLMTSRDRIRNATDGQELADWWNGDDRKRACYDFKLTRPEYRGLLDFCTARVQVLKEGGTQP